MLHPQAHKLQTNDEFVHMHVMQMLTLFCLLKRTRQKRIGMERDPHINAPPVLATEAVSTLRRAPALPICHRSTSRTRQQAAAPRPHAKAQSALPETALHARPGKNRPHTAKAATRTPHGTAKKEKWK